MSVWDIEDCIIQDDKRGYVSDECASYVSGNKYKINDNVIIHSKGQLVETPNLPFTNGRSIHTDFKLGDYFYYNGTSVQSECVTPIHMEYEHKRIYDFKHPTSGVKQGTNKQLTLGQQICSPDLFKTYINGYDRI